MTFKELASRITGVSFPVFGISWNPPKPDIEVAKNVITYLEDKRVLYNPYALEVPTDCMESVISMRKYLTEQLILVNKVSELNDILKAMRNACRKFLDMTNRLHFLRKPVQNKYYSKLENWEEMFFFSGIGELRGTMGILIAKILIMYGIDCEDNLLKIIPH